MEDQIKQVSEQPSETPKISKYSPSQIAIFLGGIIFLLVLAGAAFTAFKSSSSNQNANTTQQADTTKPLNLAPYSLVYGVWTTDNSLIKSFDLESGKTYLLASLPTNVKKITVLDSNRLLYIADTDTQDHGKEIDIYNIKDKTSTPIIKATDGFGIDDYVVSPNKQYLADWEVQMDPSTNTFLNGKSRVYTVNLSSPSVKHLIYDEVASNPVHYPSGILDNGEIYLDTFLPNSGAGWAYGMSVSDFTGSQKQNLANMKNGTYGTQPELSPDGKYFVFAGYDGKDGDGANNVEGIRRVIIESNTIEILDTSNNERTQLKKLPSTNIYASAEWGNSSNTVVYLPLSLNSKKSNYTYTLSDEVIHQLTLKDINSTVIHEINSSLYLTGDLNTSSSSLGNLGPKYTPLVSNLQLFNDTEKVNTSLPIRDAQIQYIDTVPQSYFATTASFVTDEGNDQLQLDTFPLKTSLAPVREEQMQQPIAEIKHNNLVKTPDSNLCSIEVVNRQCAYVLQQSNESGPQKAQCAEDAKKGGASAPRSCPCPLYLYGESGTKVDVKINTSISNTNALYDNGFHVTLAENGVMKVSGKQLNKISYYYSPGVSEITPPDYGNIVSYSDFKNTLTTYARNLGLNNKETNDLIAESLSRVSSPYVFVSFFNNAISKKILPSSISPQPDTQRTIVFYFKQLGQKPNYTPVPPAFEKIQRHGLTAIEISEIVE